MQKIVNNPLEFEVMILMGTLDTLDEVLSFDIFDILGEPGDQMISFKHSHSQKYFYLNLVDFICPVDDTFSLGKQPPSLLSGLVHIAETPTLGSRENIRQLKTTLNRFVKWLEQKVKITLWAPNIDKNAALNISRKEMIKICGNINKHRITRLGRTAKEVQKVFANSGTDISYDEAILCLENFYEKFHYDVLAYHASYIAEMLINIRITIHIYLRPVYSSRIRYTGEINGAKMYKYEIPEDIKGEVTKNEFYNLLNNIRGKRNFRPIKVIKYAKTHF